MKITNIIAMSLSTGNEVLSIPLDIDGNIESDIKTDYKVKSLCNTENLTIECENPKVNVDIMSKLFGKISNKYDIEYSIPIQIRKHKKKRINKKWAKRYGYKLVTKTTKGWKLKTYTDGSFEFVK